MPILSIAAEQLLRSFEGSHGYIAVLYGDPAGMELVSLRLAQWGDFQEQEKSKYLHITNNGHQLLSSMRKVESMSSNIYWKK